MYVFMFVLGACLGSFGNVIIARLPKSLSVVRPRSRCPQCQTMISWYDNIPIFSWMMLRGQCRACRTKISIRYPLVELITALMFVALYWKVGLSVTLMEYAIFSWAGLVASCIDLDHRILPDVITLPGIVVGLAGALLNPDRSFLGALSGVLMGGGFLWAVAFIYYAVRKEEGMGGGDIKLIAWIGAVLGWKAVIFSIIVSSITGSIVGLFVALLNKSGAGMKTAIPFGPFLVFAAILFIFVGQPIMGLYLSVFFPFVE